MPVRILIVDDSVTIRAMLEQLISADPDCLVVGAASGVDVAQALLKTRRADVITLDLAMPGIGGMTFLEDMGQCAHPRIVVISSSSKPGAKETADALRAGAVACFDKKELFKDVPQFLCTLKRAGQPLSRSAKPKVRTKTLPIGTGRNA